MNLIELNWLGHPKAIAGHLMLLEGQKALIDPGPASTLPELEKQLATHGVGVDELSGILLTHIHMDHAGATGSLVRRNPRIKVYVHANGAGHMADPAKLLSSAARLYGDQMEMLFGEFPAVPAGNLHVLQGGETLRLGTRELRVLYTPGHASHHVTYFDETEGVAFVGDTAGICVEGNAFVLPATPPPDINLELWDASLDSIAALRPSRLFLTHFGFSDEPLRHIENYRERLHYWSEMVGRLLASSTDEGQAMEAFADGVNADALRSLPAEEAKQYISNGALNLSWMGLARYHRKRTLGTAKA